MSLQLEREWDLGEPIGRGGFGEVVAAASSDYPSAVAKFVPKAAGADRELLFADLQGVRNVMPIIDRGETETHWVLVMPRADTSLLDRMREAAAPLPVEEALRIITDIVVALVDLEGRVVHRDVKPANILFWQGHWVLTDFGISRYAEATTSPDTRKFAMSPPYAAPERWRSERASTATDVYSLGVVAYELLAGSLPFSGPGIEDFREQHLHAQAPSVEGVPTRLATLVDECLYKAAEARPTPRNLEARLARTTAPDTSPGIVKLENSNRFEVVRRGEQARRASELRTESERLEALADIARRQLQVIATSLSETIIQAAPTVSVVTPANQYWTIELRQARLVFSAPAIIAFPWHTSRGAGLKVVLCSGISVTRPADEHGYEGRSHSIWFCDAQEVGHYRWFETAFMFSPLLPRATTRDPFALDPGLESARALSRGMAGVQVVWPFTALQPGEVDEFLDRWAGWFADAANGDLHHPSLMPERTVEGSWREI